MDTFNNFLESTTIHGLAYISTARNWLKLFWVVVVVSGFIGASALIYSSFQAWEESPVTTTIETRPIIELPLPKVTVCPPKHTYTDLNYDLMLMKNVTITNTTRNTLKEFAVELLLERLHDAIMTNLSKLQEKNMYSNWYNGFTLIVAPFVESGNLNLIINTYAKSGTIMTENFGKQFEIDDVETDLWFNVLIFPGYWAEANVNLTLHLEIEKMSLIDLSTDSKDRLYLGFNNDFGVTEELLNAKETVIHRAFTPPGDNRFIRHERKVTRDEVQRMKLKTMPGFKVKWYYSEEINPDPHYQTDLGASLLSNIDFIRIPFSIYNNVNPIYSIEILLYPPPPKK